MNSQDSRSRAYLVLTALAAIGASFDQPDAMRADSLLRVGVARMSRVR